MPRAASVPAPIAYDVVVPTVGRPSLARLLAALGRCPEPLPERVVLVDDRVGREPTPPGGAGPAAGAGAPSPLPLGLDVPAALAGRVAVLRSGGRGPAAARNVGWRAGTAAWVAFLDDDVVPDAGWTTALQEDLRAAAAGTAGTQGRIAVPLPATRRPTDWERNVAGLASARWATADLAYRRAALAAVGGFDERFRRNYREDADLGLRLRDAGWEIALGTRRIVHPVGPADRWVSLRLQAGNADDALMDALHGPHWRARAGAPRGRLARHHATAAAGLAAAALAAMRHPRAAAVAGAAWTAGTAELAVARIAPGPRTPDEIATMLLTSAALPFAASGWRIAGRARAARAVRALDRPAAVLFDRDGTLVVDVPYNGDPARVRPMPGAAEALASLRAAGVPTAVVSNQSGIARGLLRPEQVAAVNRRVDELLGPLGPWLVCPHGPGDGCACRKPAPGLVLEAARRLRVDPARCVLIGDIGADVEAARAAGARGVLVPTAATEREEIASAQEVAPDLASAVRLLLDGAQ
jgi:histidinol-phosphate phosphatase family protein